MIGSGENRYPSEVIQQQLLNNPGGTAQVLRPVSGRFLSEREEFC